MYTSEFLGTLRTFSFSDALDIVIVAYLTCVLLKMIVHNARAERLFKGVVVLALMYGASLVLNLITLSFVLKNFVAIGAIVIVVVFQPELRRVLEHFGRTRYDKRGRWFGNGGAGVNSEMINLINVLSDACETMAHQKTGALIVVEREELLDEVARTGTILDAVVTKELLLNIFFVNTPLHDGAVIVGEGKIHAAGCILPLSSNSGIDKKYGTRHRAALGVSEGSDAVVLVVSEERGEMSLVYRGKIVPVKTASELKEKLLKSLPAEEPSEEIKGLELLQNRVRLLLESFGKAKAKLFKSR